MKQRIFSFFSLLAACLLMLVIAAIGLVVILPCLVFLSLCDIVQYLQPTWKITTKVRIGEDAEDDCACRR